MPTLDFQLDPGHEFVELNQLLKLAGLCDSGGAGKAMVASGMVSVDGVVESRKTAKIRAGQQVQVGDTRIEVHAPA
jgi:ribosome-associated protein